MDLIPEMKPYNRGDGVCIHLKADNTCAIYEHRPNLCNGKYVYEKYYSDKTVDEYHKIITEYCKIIRRGNIEGLFKKV
ncbi:MAG: YkgJ family cysteine cluster protein [Selenomonadaceae bacterium]|nr:YkgJ family cysteine cluster protein [Selenomonadaceae bacterium]